MTCKEDSYVIRETDDSKVSKTVRENTITCDNNILVVRYAKIVSSSCQSSISESCV